MSHLSSRFTSLLLAAAVVASAAGISFAALLHGTDVYADEGPEAGTSTQVESQAPKDDPDVVLSSSKAESRLLADTVTPRVVDDDKTTDRPAIGATIQDAIVSLENSEPGIVSPGKGAEISVSIIDYGITEEEYNNYFSGSPDVKFKLDRNTFENKEENPNPDDSGENVSFSYKDGLKIDATLKGYRYTGKTDVLLLSVIYGGDKPTRPNLRFSIADYVFTNAQKTASDDAEDARHNKKDDDDDDDSSSHPDIAPPTPTLIVSEFDYGGQSVAAASDFSLKMRFTNTSKKLPIDNIVIKITVPEAFTLKGSSNTIYLEKMSKESSIERTIQMSVKPDAEPISHAVKLDFTYESVIEEARKPLSGAQEISIPVTQLDRFTLNPVELPSEIYVGDDTSIEVSFVNKGKSSIFNVSAEISGNIAQPGQRQFIGNIEAGKEDSADFLLSALEGGAVSGEILITYEDANMHITELREPFTTTAISYEPPQDDGMNTMNPMDNVPETTPWYQTIPVWGWMVGGAVLIIFAAFLVRLGFARRKEEAAFLEDEDEDL